MASVFLHRSLFNDVNPFHAKLSYLYFRSHEAVDRGNIYLTIETKHL